jgi:hypothetical protein
MHGRQGLEDLVLYSLYGQKASIYAWPIRTGGLGICMADESRRTRYTYGRYGQRGSVHIWQLLTEGFWVCMTGRLRPYRPEYFLLNCLLNGLLRVKHKSSISPDSIRNWIQFHAQYLFQGSDLAPKSGGEESRNCRRQLGRNIPSRRRNHL